MKRVLLALPVLTVLAVLAVLVVLVLIVLVVFANCEPKSGVIGAQSNCRVI